MFGMGTSVTSWVKSPEMGKGAKPTGSEDQATRIPEPVLQMAGQECTSLLTNS